MREIINLQVGSCGNQIGGKVSTSKLQDLVYCYQQIFFSPRVFLAYI